MSVADEQGFARGRVLGVTAIVVVLLALLVPVAAVSFSVEVQGHSMEPTLEEGDRLVVNFLGDESDLERFDLVDATFDEAGAGRVVKRLIGLPGDRIKVLRVTGNAPVVLIRTAGSKKIQVVDNPAWESQVGTSLEPCCDDSGKLTGKAKWSRIPDGQYWLLGDNWGGSDDSRKYGFVKASAIGARLNFRIMPLGRFGSVENDVRLVDAPVG